MLLSLVLGYSFQSQAALLIEPVIGYSFGKEKLDYSGISTGSESNSLKGLSYGGRLGYQNLGFQLGLDYLASKMDVDGDDLNTGEWGGFVGFEFPVLLRVYAGYIFTGSAEYKSDGSTTNFSGASGPKLGLGLTLLPFLDFNIEYRQVKFDTKKDINPGLDVDLSYSAVMVGFSLPFTL